MRKMLMLLIRAVVVVRRPNPRWLAAVKRAAHNFEMYQCKKLARARRVERKIVMNNTETNSSTNPTAESNDKRADRSTLPNHNLPLSKKEAGTA